MTELVLQRPTAVSAWVAVCSLDDLEECWGEAALVGGEQIALFRLPGNLVHAVGNIDPRTQAAVMARGIVGSRGAAPTIASPLHKEIYDLATGACLSGGQGLRAYPVRCVDGVVEVGVLEVGPVEARGAA
ncbi:nitrite reductase small subunit NirD [Arthrobacter sp. MDT2-2]